jgi:putative PIN family toxin of toxin-antitoxin system
VLIKAVIDTNVWISALLNPGTARQIVSYLYTGGFQLVCSGELLAELLRVLSRPKVSATFDQEDVDELLGLIQDKSFFVELQHIAAISRDPKDDMFLACAAASQSDYLVTGDNDLLTLKAHQSTKIVTPRQFLELLTSDV